MQLKFLIGFIGTAIVKWRCTLLGKTLKECEEIIKGNFGLFEAQFNIKNMGADQGLAHERNLILDSKDVTKS